VKATIVVPRTKAIGIGDNGTVAVNAIEAGKRAHAVIEIESVNRTITIVLIQAVERVDVKAGSKAVIRSQALSRTRTTAWIHVAHAVKAIDSVKIIEKAVFFPRIARTFLCKRSKSVTRLTSNLPSPSWETARTSRNSTQTLH
jgi:hypothetical protein